MEKLAKPIDHDFITKYKYETSLCFSSIFSLCKLGMFFGAYSYLESHFIRFKDLSLPPPLPKLINLNNLIISQHPLGK